MASNHMEFLSKYGCKSVLLEGLSLKVTSFCVSWSLWCSQTCLNSLQLPSFCKFTCKAKTSLSSYQTLAFSLPKMSYSDDSHLTLADIEDINITARMVQNSADNLVKQTAMLLRKVKSNPYHRKSNYRRYPVDNQEDQDEQEDPPTQPPQEEDESMENGGADQEDNGGNVDASPPVQHLQKRKRSLTSAFDEVATKKPTGKRSRITHYDSDDGYGGSHTDSEAFLSSSRSKRHHQPPSASSKKRKRSAAKNTFIMKVEGAKTCFRCNQSTCNLIIVEIEHPRYKFECVVCGKFVCWVSGKQVEEIRAARKKHKKSTTTADAQEDSTTATQGKEASTGDQEDEEEEANDNTLNAQQDPTDSATASPQR